MKRQNCQLNKLYKTVIFKFFKNNKIIIKNVLIFTEILKLIT